MKSYILIIHLSIHKQQELEELVTKMENEKEREIHIDQRFHRTIIGTKGDKIKEIRDKFNQVQISFPDPGESVGG